MLALLIFPEERSDRCRWQIKGGEQVAGVEKFKEQRKPAEFFRHPNITRQVSSAYMCLTSVFGMGSEGSAACGGRSDPSEWQRSTAAKVLRHRRQMSGTATGNRWTSTVPICTKISPQPFGCGESICWHYLFSRAVTRQVSSAYMCLTSVFGMAASPSAAGGR